MNPSDVTLREVVEEYLKDHGYVQSPDDDSYWFPPDGMWADKIIPTIIDCFYREDS